MMSILVSCGRFSRGRVCSGCGMDVILCLLCGVRLLGVLIGVIRIHDQIHRMVYATVSFLWHQDYLLNKTS